MVSREEGRQRVALSLSRHLLETGLSQTSLRQLAKASGVSDRMLLYYYTDKAAALSAAMANVAAGLTARMETAMPLGTVMPARAFAAAVAHFTISAESAPVMRLWIEVVAAAARGEAPFPQLAGTIAAGFIDWAEARLDPAELTDPRAMAVSIIALIDGLAVIGVCADEDLVARAAASLVDLV